jgi:hypothetical protein
VLEPKPKVRKFEMHVADPLEDWSRERAITLAGDLNPQAVNVTARVVDGSSRINQSRGIPARRGIDDPINTIPPLPNSDGFGCGVRGW